MLNKFASLFSKGCRLVDIAEELLQHTLPLMFIDYFKPLPCRYLVDVRWMKQWKKYVGYDQQDLSNAGLDSAYPGPIDNSTLFKGTLDRFISCSSIDLMLFHIRDIVL